MGERDLISLVGIERIRVHFHKLWSIVVRGSAPYPLLRWVKPQMSGSPCVSSRVGKPVLGQCIVTARSVPTKRRRKCHHCFCGRRGQVYKPTRRDPTCTGTARLG